ncbi:DUF2599 domain-containing protein [Cellulosimicrobium cellulans]|uniref:DUF2599 domain-containing protein n=1 Tax=Cellulosimicrobium cellulans TaxID=1710 RepID=UPI001C0B4EA7|nr:DUF2599 domain-containing protein [Cellulosimicrobium cellulans]
MTLPAPGRGAPTRAAAVLAGVLALGACTGTPDPAPAPTPPSASATAPESGDAPSPTTDPAPVALASGAVAFDVAVPGPAGEPGVDPLVQVEPADDGAAVLTVRPGVGPATLALTTPGTLTANPDGTVTVLDAAGTPVGGLSAPAVADDGTGPADGSPTPRAVLAVTGPATAELVVRQDGEPSGSTDAPASAPDASDDFPVTTTLGTTTVRSAVCGDREGGLSLAVDATPWARTAGVAGSDVLWAQLVAAEPDADAPGMRDQLVCHALGAPDKATWNLEPWRPDVGLVAVLAAHCNPS